jgi:hypothetical protein
VWSISTNSWNASGYYLFSFNFTFPLDGVLSLNNNSLFIHLYELHVSQSTSYQKGLKISKGSSECVYGRRTDNTMFKRKDAKG